MEKTLSVVKELNEKDLRVALVPKSIAKLVQLGLTILVEKGAGERANFLDSDYEKEGAKIVTRKEALDSDIIFTVNELAESDVSSLKKGVKIFGNFHYYKNKDLISKFNSKEVEIYSLDLLPRISRAQSMDILSSQNNLAGYRAVVEAANLTSKIFPMMMTAAGMLSPTKVFVLGTGVAGLQAIATAKRLGAQVTAYDVRSATKEQVESLGGKFLLIEQNENAETKGGYAKEMSEEHKKKVEDALLKHVAMQDIIITTALIPGKKAPVIITEEMVKKMAAGSVIVDMAAEAGGNCEVTENNKTVVKHGVTILGNSNLQSSIAKDSSTLFSNNLVNFLSYFYNKDTKSISIDYGDEIILATLVAKNGNLTHKEI